MLNARRQGSKANFAISTNEGVISLAIMIRYAIKQITRTIVVKIIKLDEIKDVACDLRLFLP